jgi:chromosome segregation ATPase
MTNSEFFKKVGIPNREEELKDISKSALLDKIIKLEDELKLAIEERDLNYDENAEAQQKIKELEQDKSDLCMDVVELQQRNETHNQNEKKLMEENENLKLIIGHVKDESKKITEENFENYKLLKSLEKELKELKEAK